MSASDESGEYERPSGRLRPEDGELGTIHEMLVDQEYQDALETIEEASADEPLEHDWLGYLQGLALLGTRELDEAYKSFRSTAERITSASTDQLQEDRYRIAAKCLKKMGWYHRRGDGHARAYAYHSMEYELVDGHGSPLELHDAALSLDVVSYHLRIPQISKRWIQRSIEAASGIEGDSDRRKALGISWNNLTGTLCDLGDFKAAGEAAETSLEHWKRYEELEGKAENRLVWARHILGDAFKRWGDYLVSEGDIEEGLDKLDRARTSLEAAIDEAGERGMSDEDRRDIEGKLDDVRDSVDTAKREAEERESDDSESSEPEGDEGDESEPTDADDESDETDEGSDEEAASEEQPDESEDSEGAPEDEDE